MTVEVNPVSLNITLSSEKKSNSIFGTFEECNLRGKIVINDLDKSIALVELPSTTARIQLNNRNSLSDIHLLITIYHVR